jgi:hypothetical protein
VRTGSAVLSFEGCCHAIRSVHHVAVLLPYLGEIVQAHWTGDVVLVWRIGLARRIPALVLAFVLASGILLRIIFNLCVLSVQRVMWSSHSMYLSGDGAIAVDWRGVDSGGVGTRGSQMVRGVGGPSSFH